MAEKTDLIDRKHKALRKHKDGKRLTYEETALAVWDEKTEDKPMSAMGIYKIEKRALEKLKAGLKKYGITCLDDVFEPKDREVAKKVTSSAVDI